MVKCSVTAMIEILEALKDGKTIQCTGKNSGIEYWYDVTAGPNETLESRIIHLMDNACILRIKPEPKMRPWTMAETPELLWIAPKHYRDDLYLVTRKKPYGVETQYHYGHDTITYDRLYQDFVWRGEKGWESCGKEVIQ